MNFDEDVIPRTIAFLRERLGAEAEPAVALILARDKFGTVKYGKPLQTFDGRNTLWDRAEELADDLNYTLKFIAEWGEVAGLLERAVEVLVTYFALYPPKENSIANKTAIELRETAARMRRDIERIEPEVTQ
jgi:hypothetical protein